MFQPNNPLLPWYLCPNMKCSRYNKTCLKWYSYLLTSPINPKSLINKIIKALYEIVYDTNLSR